MSSIRSRMSPARQKLVERVLAVAAVVAVLVAFGAWWAMGRSAGADTASADGGSTGSDEYSTSIGADGEDADGGGSDADGSGDGADDGSSDDPADGSAGSDGTSSDGSGSSGSGTSGNGSSGSGTSGNGSSGSGTSGNGSSGTPGTDGSTSPSGRTPPPTGPATAFLAALDASGLAPPADAEVRLAFGQDVCTELGYGAPRADVVRAVTFAGASDAEAENLVSLAITHLCPQHA
jgi:hypothetical protein